MKKALMVSVSTFLVITLLSYGVYLIYKNRTKNNFENKLKYLSNNWNELLKLQDEKNNLLEALIENSPRDIKYIDSLNQYLSMYRENNSKECNFDFVYDQYLSNKYMLPLMEFHSDHVELGDSEEKQRILEQIENKIMLINEVVQKYNRDVKNYNNYYISFPNFIVARSYGFKKMEYFEIEFGIENIDPKVKRKERREWQKKIEIEHGLVE